LSAAIAQLSTRITLKCKPTHWRISYPPK